MVSASATKTRMARLPFVAGVQFLAPLIEQRQRLRAVADLIAQIVRDAAVGIDGMKVRAQRLGQKPRSHVEVFVVRLGQMLAPGARLIQRRRDCGNAIAGRQRGPALLQQFSSEVLGKVNRFCASGSWIGFSAHVSCGNASRRHSCARSMGQDRRS
jgi:hypothetical protein